ncbi:uncharacterized protein EI90DRAFT_82692 [Cantharellus anzutake]|uniref:uncharacterized protein n=1 Tax=Cantharellus anzutake TaxID=1750568 RepID=UPI0019050CD4|nr:uncharacterized protein EI90DRAFT_82692 [Cantharellus anzutake]KAF8336885.1 hypothetical protein EI90DRAFT_82692 [Cantharellus anzutake]
MTEILGVLPVASQKGLPTLQTVYKNARSYQFFTHTHTLRPKPNWKADLDHICKWMLHEATIKHAGARRFHHSRLLRESCRRSFNVYIRSKTFVIQVQGAQTSSVYTLRSRRVVFAGSGKLAGPPPRETKKSVGTCHKKIVTTGISSWRKVALPKLIR